MHQRSPYFKCFFFFWGGNSQKGLCLQGSDRHRDNQITAFKILKLMSRKVYKTYKRFYPRVRIANFAMNKWEWVATIWQHANWLLASISCIFNSSGTLFNDILSFRINIWTNLTRFNQSKPITITFQRKEELSEKNNYVAKIKMSETG